MCHAQHHQTDQRTYGEECPPILRNFIQNDCVVITPLRMTQATLVATRSDVKTALFRGFSDAEDENMCRFDVGCLLGSMDMM